MCTILSVSKEYYGRPLWNRIYQDACNNPHGYALILVDEAGASTVLRTLNLDTVFTLLEAGGWSRMFLHCRFATQGSVTLDNTHGWGVNGTFYMHNGVLMNPAADRYAVDSQLIGEWLREGTLAALDRLYYEPYANVFVVDTTEGYYGMHRSATGTLFTDWQGNYSSNRFGRCRHAVPMYTNQTHWIIEPKAQPLLTVKGT